MKAIRHFFWLSRPLNVLITLIAFALAAHMAQGDILQCLRDAQFWYGCVALTVITATGYWVNDAFDFKIDRENKPRKVIVNAHLSVKKVLTAVASKDKKAKDVLAETIKVIDKAAKHGVIKRETASRKISRLTKFVNNASAAPAAK